MAYSKVNELSLNYGDAGQELKKAIKAIEENLNSIKKKVENSDNRFENQIQVLSGTIKILQKEIKSNFFNKYQPSDDLSKSIDKLANELVVQNTLKEKDINPVSTLVTNLNEDVNKLKSEISSIHKVNSQIEDIYYKLAKYEEKIKQQESKINEMQNFQKEILAKIVDTKKNEETPKEERSSDATVTDLIGNSQKFQQEFITKMSDNTNKFQHDLVEKLLNATLQARYHSRENSNEIKTNNFSETKQTLT